MRRSKYNARRTEVDGITFDSASEAARYVELKLLERAGKIRGLELQPRYELIKAFTTSSGERVRGITYVGDFRYVDKTGAVVVEDVKGVKTDVYKIKRKLLLWRHPDINFVEIT